jgi:hypothetical protein
MPSFTTIPNSFHTVRNRLLLNYIVILVLLVGFMWYLNSNPADVSAQANDRQMWFVLVPLLVISFGVGIFTGIRKQKRAYESLVFTVNSNKIIKESQGLPSITLAFEDVSRITKTDQGVLTIFGAENMDAIVLPAQMTEADQLAELLNTIKPLEHKKQNPLISLLSIPIAILTVGLLAVIYTAEDKWLVGLSGLVVCVGLLAAFAVIQRSKNVDFRTKQLSYIVFIPLLCFGAITLVKIFQ